MNKNIKYLVGKKAKLDFFLEPFNSQIINFLDDLSKSLDNNFNNKNFPDLKGLSFFCRKKNILSLKDKHKNKKSIRFGLGLLFHITPSNIPTNFAYSLIFGLITGNSNIVKVPSKKFEEIEIICKSINFILNKKKYFQIKDMITIVRYYSNNDLLTKKFSAICDGRLIWGGDKTITDIKKFETKPKNIDIPFADRYSISLINSEKFLKLPEYKIKNLVKNFYNDTYVVDQNACSSPHLIIWTGKEIKKAKDIFWNNLKELVYKEYNMPEKASIEKYTQLCENLLNLKDIKSEKRYGNLIYTIELKKLNFDLHNLRGKWGYFFEYNCNDISHLIKYFNDKFQTLTYFGFKKEYFQELLSKKNFNKIDRIVPIGQALNIDLIWDGYDLTKMLSKIIDIK